MNPLYMFTFDTRVSVDRLDTEPRIADARGGDPTLVIWHFMPIKRVRLLGVAPTLPNHRHIGARHAESMPPA